MLQLTQRPSKTQEIIHLTSHIAVGLLTSVSQSFNSILRKHKIIKGKKLQYRCKYWLLKTVSFCIGSS